MNFGNGLIAAQVQDAQALRTAGADWLSLALLDARNRTLGWLAAFDDLRFPTPIEGFDPPWWLAGQAGWFQDHWIGRHLQRGRGAAADPSAPRLASVEPCADGWFSPATSSRLQRWQDAPPDPASLRDYLAATLDTTLDLLDRAAPDEAALYFFRVALLHEDRLGEALAVLVQALDLAPERQQPLVGRSLWPAPGGHGRREAIGLPGQTWNLGAPRPVDGRGWAPDAEQWAHPVPVAEFEIDAQPVSWSQFAEFVDDGGYDERHWWTRAGWDWVEAGSRRAPRYVEQVAGTGVLARRQGRLQCLPGSQAARHVSAHEADAWCRWAGRRLPTEAEWELAAASAGPLGFAWGELLEWVAGAAQPFPGGSDGPAALDACPDGAPWRVLRGASAWGSARLRHLRSRRYAAPQCDELFVGFRSCAL